MLTRDFSLKNNPKKLQSSSTTTTTNHRRPICSWSFELIKELSEKSFINIQQVKKFNK